MIVLMGGAFCCAVVVVIGELTVGTVLVVIGGSYCSYCGSGDRGSLL